MNKRQVLKRIAAIWKKYKRQGGGRKGGRCRHRGAGFLDQLTYANALARPPRF